MNSSWIVSQEASALTLNGLNIYLVEKERTVSGKIGRNSDHISDQQECSFTCLRCVICGKY
jgi:heterodisulfide reductase subunit A-like polyferredoxin